MKKCLVMVLALSFLSAAIVFAKGQGQGSGAPAKRVVIQIGYENSAGHPIDTAAKEWKRIVEEKSGGAMEVQLFPNSQLGAKNAILDQMQAGMNVITLADGAFLADRGAPDLGIMFAPYLISNLDEAWKLEKSDWFKSQSDLLEKKGLKIVTANWFYGDRHTVTTKPIRSVADFRGLKIRVPNNTIQAKGIEVMGATPTPMALGEVYTSLQQGVIDGMENPLTTIYENKAHEVAKFITLDGHIKNITIWLCGTTFFNSLTPEQQKILCEAGDAAGLVNNAEVEKQTQVTLDKLKAEGATIIEVSDIRPFQEQARKFYDMPEIQRLFSPGIYDTVTRAMGR